MPENGSLWSPQNLVRRAHESSATAMAMPRASCGALSYRKSGSRTVV